MSTRDKKTPEISTKTGGRRVSRPAALPLPTRRVLSAAQRRQRESARVTCGLYVKAANGLRLRTRRVRRLVRKMWKVMPWLSPSDEPSARAWAELAILGARMFAELDTAGFLNAKTHEPRRLVTEYRQLRRAQVAYSRELGMTPAARAALGLAVSTGQHHNVAAELAQLRLARERNRGSVLDGEAT